MRIWHSSSESTCYDYIFQIHDYRDQITQIKGAEFDYIPIVHRRNEQAQQTDGVSCGVFTMFNAERFMKHQGPVRELLPGHVRTLRRRYVQMYYDPKYFEEQLAALVAQTQRALAGGGAYQPVPTLAQEAGEGEWQSIESAHVPVNASVETLPQVGASVHIPTSEHLQTRRRTQTLAHVPVNTSVETPPQVGACVQEHILISEHLQTRRRIQTPASRNRVRRTLRTVKTNPTVFKNRDSLMARVTVGRPDLQQSAVRSEHHAYQVRRTNTMRKSNNS